ncbi:MAG: CAP domain-containing protein [Longibaculum sp.]
MKTYLNIILMTLMIVSTQVSISTQVTSLINTSQNVQKEEKMTVSKKETKKQSQIKSSQKTSQQTSKTTSTQNKIFNSHQIALMRSTFVQLINQERQQPVSLDSQLLASCQTRAHEASQKWSHTRPNGSRWNTTLTNIINIKITPHGENLAQTRINIHDLSDEELIQIVKQLHNGLVNSPTHYHVMTNTEYKKVNIGIDVSSKDNLYIITIAQHYIA